MRLAAGLALLLLAGCTPPGGSQADSGGANRSATNRAAAAPAPDPIASSPLVGRWADDPGACTRPIEIFGNGTVRASDGTRGHWRLAGDRLTFILGQRTFAFTLVSVTRDRVVLIDSNNQRGESIRCP